MSAEQLKELAATLAAIADGAEWECQWEVDGWGPPMGRDVEYCIANRVAIRTKNPQAPKPKDDGGPAFPQNLAFNPTDGAEAIVSEYYHKSEGMTLRDWFAGKALQGLASNPLGAQAYTQCGENVSISGLAYFLADAMIEARDRSNGKNGSDVTEALLAVVKMIPQNLHPANDNDDGRPCICSTCELVRAADSALALAEGGGK